MKTVTAMFACMIQISDVGLTEDVKGDERKFELWTKDHSQTYVLQVSDDFCYFYHNRL